MASSALKPLISGFVNPIARALLRLGATPDVITVAGALSSIAASLYFFSRGDLFLGSLIVSLTALSDLFDGAMARLSDHGPSKWGGFLDSTLDRVTDMAIWIGLIIYLEKSGDSLTYVALAALGLGLLIPYIRAKSESFGIACTVGIAERTERLILALTSIGLAGLGLDYVLSVGVWVSAALALITVGQRINVVRHGLREV
jgi:CDP-diacylglycerol--glycerol-3-phosphate 3-phosphatidyltransferase